MRIEKTRPVREVRRRCLLNIPHSAFPVSRRELLARTGTGLGLLGLAGVLAPAGPGTATGRDP